MKLLRSRLLVAAFLALAACAAFSADSRKKLVLLIAEPEYETATTLPEFAAKQLAQDFRVVTVSGSIAAGENTFDRIAEIADADVLLISVRRRTPPQAQFELIRRHILAGKPVVGIRTASHAFSLGKGQTLAAGNADWPQFDAEVIGGNYANHHAKGPVTTVSASGPASPAHLILRGVTLPFTSESSLYKERAATRGCDRTHCRHDSRAAARAAGVDVHAPRRRADVLYFAGQPRRFQKPLVRAIAAERDSLGGAITTTAWTLPRWRSAAVRADAVRGRLYGLRPGPPCVSVSGCSASV